MLLKNLPAVLEDLRPYLLAIAREEIPDKLAAKAGASDLVQETCELALRHQDQYRGTTNAELRAWLAQILRRRVIALRRRYLSAARRVAQEISLSGNVEEHATHQLPDPLPSPCEIAMARESNRNLQMQITALPEEERVVISLRLNEELSFAAIAVRLRLSETTVRRIFGRAVCFLQAHWREEE